MLAMLLSSVYTTLQTCMEINAIHCWTDSQVVLNWIRSKKAITKPFVNNRVEHINSLVSKDCWDYCPSHVNPADIASRGIPCSKHKKNSLWWNGPPYLEKESDFWPKMNSTSSQPEEIMCNIVSTEKQT